MRRKELESILQGLSTFRDPKPELEQYPTSGHLACQIVYTAESMFGDIEDQNVLDLGCGCGTLR